MNCSISEVYYFIILYIGRHTILEICWPPRPNNNDFLLLLLAICRQKILDPIPALLGRDVIYRQSALKIQKKDSDSNNF